ncbi:hypothetical protein WMF26_13470 [Sorangium sp. So ce185]|uniref:hypothetical protein n=1 Tax=Sorangium sp. So ce185 TaxID=3133287 RepID=UPI003F633481
MRHWRGLMGITAMAFGAAMVPGTGCVFGVDYNDCAEYPGGVCGGGTGGSGGEEPPDPCEADPREDPSVVSEGCGVFARAGAEEGGEGTRQRPYGSLQEAIEKATAEGKRVYACAEGEAAFEESVKVEAGLEVIGSFACAGWTLEAGRKSALAGPADQVALTLGEGAEGARVEGFAIRAADAKQDGGSSIGVVVADVEAELAEVEVTAGNGKDGARGTTPEEAPVAGASAEAGGASNACVAENAVLGGAAGVTSCEDGETAGGRGGLGGSGETDEGNGQVGEDGGPVPEENPMRKGLGGVGETASQDCERGNDGKSGTAGPAGVGGTGATLALTGLSGGDGDAGKTGGRGQGGGGGGGAKAGLFCKLGPDTIDGVGASGGGGGAGGCGGKGGGGGQAGGSSVGIVSLGNRLKLTGVTIAVGKGGNGGAGAAGQSGAAGGNGAAGGTASGTAPSRPGCQGGNGGLGGPGGAGGGGRGGYAVGVAYAVTPSEAPAVQFAAGTPGLGGNAGPGGAMETAGAPGSDGSCWDFAKRSPCGG